MSLEWPKYIDAHIGPCFDTLPSIYQLHTAFQKAYIKDNPLSLSLLYLYHYL
jgi:hypothetical protein